MIRSIGSSPALAAAAGLLVLLPASPRSTSAQDFRGSVVSSARYVEVRPLVLDSVDRSRITVGPDGGLTFEGRPVRCEATGVCTFFTSPETESAVTLRQDYRVTGWGMGVTGLSATVAFRLRQSIGSDFVWPLAEDPFDLLVGYVQLSRENFRIRAGRQQSVSGLGYDSYDGLSALFEPTDWLDVSAYGGRSLARGLHDPRHEALRGIEDFLPDRNAYLVGTEATAQPLPGTSVTGRYQREIWSDRSGLVSERASLDVRTGLLRPVGLSGSMDYDFARGIVGKGHLTASLPLAEGTVVLEATGRRYVPYFELWTIWGLFNPVAYHEGVFRGTWSPAEDLGLWLEGGYRRYDDASFDPILGGVEDDAVRGGVGARWRARPELFVTGSYRVERGAGAFHSSADVSGRWSPDDRFSIGAHLTATQQIEEFRTGEGVVAGGGLDGEVRLTDRLHLSGGGAVYRQAFENRPGTVDWNQLRAWTSLRVKVGSDPGLSTGEAQ